MKALYNPKFKFLAYLLFLIVYPLTAGKIVVYSQESDETSINWSLPFHECINNRLKAKNNISELASDNGESLTVSTSTGSLALYDIKHGAILWENDLGSQFVSNIEQDSRAVFTATSTNLGDNTVSIRSISSLTGITLWQTDIQIIGEITLKLVDSSLFVISDTSIINLSGEKGVENWSIVNSKTLDARGLIDSQTTKETLISLVEKVSEIFGQNGIQTNENYSYFANNSFIIRGNSKGTVSSYEKESGKRLWSMKAGGKITSILELGNDKILVGSLDNFLYLLSAKNGNLHWKRRLPFRIVNKPAIMDDVVMVTSIGMDSVYWVNLETGKTVNQVLFGESSFLTAMPLMIDKQVFVPTNLGLRNYSLSGCENEKGAKSDAQLNKFLNVR